MIGTLQGMDVGILMAIQGLRSNALDPLMQTYTAMGDLGLIWIVLSGGLMCYRPTRHVGMLAILALMMGLICTNLLLKPLVARPRPWLDIAGLVPLIVEPDPYSFPSGHTCAAFATAVMFWRAMPETWTGVKALAVVMAALMGLSRLYVGVHYPSDVLVGAMIGSACAWCVWHIYMVRSQ